MPNNIHSFNRRVLDHCQVIGLKGIIGVISRKTRVAENVCHIKNLQLIIIIFTVVKGKLVTKIWHYRVNAAMKPVEVPQRGQLG